MAKSKNPAAVALGRNGGKKGGPARAASMTAEQRSQSARKAVLARWAKAGDKSGNGPPRVESRSETKLAPAISVGSKQALHLCLKRLKNARDDNEVRRLAEELQRIVFHKQYRNAKD
jgi:hypothetical protein